MTEKNLKVDVFASTHTGLAFLREFSLKWKKKKLESYIEQLIERSTALCPLPIISPWSPCNPCLWRSLSFIFNAGRKRTLPPNLVLARPRSHTLWKIL